jgi:hypothetical protein
VGEQAPPLAFALPAIARTARVPPGGEHGLQTRGPGVGGTTVAQGSVRLLESRSPV